MTIMSHYGVSMNTTNYRTDIATENINTNRSYVLDAIRGLMGLAATYERSTLKENLRGTDIYVILPDKPKVQVQLKLDQQAGWNNTPIEIWTHLPQQHNLRSGLPPLNGCQLTTPTERTIIIRPDKAPRFTKWDLPGHAYEAMLFDTQLLRAGLLANLDTLRTKALALRDDCRPLYTNTTDDETGDLWYCGGISIGNSIIRKPEMGFIENYYGLYGV